MENPNSIPKKSGYTNDDWTIEFQTLGFEHAGEELYKMAIHAPAPFVIGVYGSWGSGKTSLLRHCMASLGGLPLSYSEGIGASEEKEIAEELEDTWNKLSENKTQALSVWFNPWQYQNEPNLMIPLLHEIRKQIPKWVESRGLSKQAAKDNAKKLLDFGLKKLTKIIDTVAEKHIGFKPAAYLYEKGMEFYKGVQPLMPYSELTDAQQFFLAFNEAVCQVRDSIKELIPKQKAPKGLADNIVIFIDDLDRCEDIKILEVLEAIKLYLNTQSCIFILGIDPEAVEKTIMRSRKDCDEAEARQYMAKLVQGNIHVPVCRDFRPFITKFVERWPEKPEETECNELAETLNEIWEHNPRKLKNFLNSLLARWKIIKNNQTQLTLNQTALLLSLQFRFPVIYRSIAFHPEDFQNFYLALEYVTLNESGNSPHAQQARGEETKKSNEKIMKQVNSETSGEEAKQSNEEMMKQVSSETSGEEAKQSNEEIMKQDNSETSGEEAKQSNEEMMKRDIAKNEAMFNRYKAELAIVFPPDAIDDSLKPYRERLFEYRYDRALLKEIQFAFKKASQESQKTAIESYFTAETIQGE